TSLTGRPPRDRQTKCTAKSFRAKEKPMADSEESPKQVYVAAGANLVIAASKLIAAAATGSSAMLSEGIHSLADTGNELLLLVGLKRSKRAPDAEHAFGYGRELYFWGFVVAIVLFTIGGVMSIYEGVTRLGAPAETSHVVWNYAVLAIALIAETASM